jgi:hypothetical protein
MMWTELALLPPFVGYKLVQGVKPKVIQAILRHSDIATTLDFNVETPEAESREALDKLTGLMG